MSDSDENVGYGRQITPDQLAADLAEQRNSLGYTPQLTNDGLRRLLNLVYEASLMPDEGRYPRLELIVEWQQRRENYTDEEIPFASRIPLESSDALRRLAPCLRGHNVRLLVTETTGCLYASALQHSSSLSLESGQVFPHLPTAFSGGPAGFTIQIAGPANLLISEVPAYRLRYVRNYVRPVTYWDCSHTIMSWINRLAATKISSITIESPEYFQFSSLITRCISRLLYNVVESGHGGAIVFVEQSDLTSTTAPSGGQSMSHDLCDNIYSFWQHSLAAMNTKSAERLSSALQHRHQLITSLDLIARCAGIDGCVLLNKQLELECVGAKLPISNNSCKQVLDAKTKQPVTETLRRLGTRNNSAANYCQNHPGAIAFVVSTDQECNLYYSNDDGDTFAYFDTQPSIA
ncbi:MAG: hypothetical protein IT440_10575 [Phycisphaeraceae bacterium]|nr:hypothetical protein [Phycisphaeraceae bacterium]